MDGWMDIQAKLLLFPLRGTLRVIHPPDVVRNRRRVTRGIRWGIVEYLQHFVLRGDGVEETKMVVGEP